MVNLQFNFGHSSSLDLFVDFSCLKASICCLDFDQCVIRGCLHISESNDYRMFFFFFSFFPLSSLSRDVLYSWN